MSSRIPRGDTELRFMTKFGKNWLLRSCRKVTWITTQKNSRSAELVPAPILPKMGRSRPKFPERCHPLTCPRVPNLVRIGCALLDLFRKDWFFGPKSHYNIRFQPTINVCTLADQHSTFVMLLIKESGKRTFGSTSTSLQADSYTHFTV